MLLQLKPQHKISNINLGLSFVQKAFLDGHFWGIIRGLNIWRSRLSLVASHWLLPQHLRACPEATKNIEFDRVKHGALRGNANLEKLLHVVFLSSHPTVLLLPRR